MAIRVAINHKTRYRYAREVWLSPHVLRLSPAPHCRTPILSHSLRITPEEHFINWQQDPYSNRLARLVFPKKTCELAVEVDLVAEMTVINPFDFFLEPYAEAYPFEYEAVLLQELAPYLEAAPLTPKLAAYVREVRHDATRTVDYLVELNQKLQSQIKYLIRLEPGVQTPEETLTLRSGSCRDSAWLLVQVLRNLGLAARFVSGYLIQLTPDVKSLDGPSGTEKDFTDLHAWTEVFLPGAGWVGLDPTSGLMAGEGHIPLACSADPVTAAAVTGFFSYDDPTVVKADPDANDDGAHEDQGEFEFAMTITRIREEARVTKPYTDEQWLEVNRVGKKVDEDLRAMDVRLTMGGEPTFVSIDDFDGAEWNTAAMGPNKYRLADTLIRRLRDRFGPGGLLHHGMGKWYPGEPLPRWALTLYMRKEGQPIWRDPALVADDTRRGASTENEARAFARHLAEKLGIEPARAIPGYEDAFYYLWKERRLPINVDPHDSKLDNKEDRARLARIFEQGLERVIGYALPLRRVWADGARAWESGAWFLRPERMYLIPGDSPMGFRLPLDSIPWVAEGERPQVFPQDPWALRGPLPAREMMGRTQAAIRRATPAPSIAPGPRGQGGQSPFDPSSPPALGQSAPWIVRTALCIEPRNGNLRVFMPPTETLEDYLDLVAAIEDTARELSLPVLIEGYAPAYDPRIAQMRVTPDPGVIEVNTLPVETWDQLVANTNVIYEEARQTRLGTEKFMLDGRHTGTGGGNHIILGGPTPADSPLLRRPDLLRSLIAYWHNHPALSYLFSGLFVGPTSQAPRTDEARNDQLYELEVAFNQIPESGQCPPWLVDRIFRNLLIDSSGNTHRSEFCIDKLYSPDSSSGRLGLLEMRAFEMPPHARMSLAQHLLLRALVATFWRAPYRRQLVRWRTEIHDRFMLEHFVRQDFYDVLDDLSAAGYGLRREWFDAHFDFRFPHCGLLESATGVVLELRQAIEPWHVMGEEGAPGGTARYVDSSLERIQVLAKGMIDSRHIVACNGVRVPLHPTGTNGQYVAGVRYRAWQPPSCLHPTIGVHAPLVLDIVDTWSGRSLGGCTYYVAHPGGLSYDRFPVNAYEAEARRIGRFFKHGHTPGPMNVVEAPESREYPFTLDLRRL